MNHQAGPGKEDGSRKQAIMAGTPYIITKQFPWKLHEMLEKVEKAGDEAIVSWLPGGRAFKVHQSDIFVQKIMKQHFNQTKYKSFQRQLNLWGFERNTKESCERGSYYHPLFIRGRNDMCQEMGRQKIKGTPSNATKPKPAFASSGISKPVRTGTTKCVHQTRPDSSPSSKSEDPKFASANTLLASLSSQLLQQQQQQHPSSRVIQALRSLNKQQVVALSPHAGMVGGAMAPSPLYAMINPMAQADAEVLAALRKRAALETVLAAQSSFLSASSFMASSRSPFL